MYLFPFVLWLRYPTSHSRSFTVLSILASVHFLFCILITRTKSFAISPTNHSLVYQHSLPISTLLFTNLLRLLPTAFIGSFVFRLVLCCFLINIKSVRLNRKIARGSRLLNQIAHFKHNWSILNYSKTSLQKMNEIFINRFECVRKRRFCEWSCSFDKQFHTDTNKSLMCAWMRQFWFTLWRKHLRSLVCMINI